MEIKPGDKVYHKSNSSIIWVVDKIENNQVFCSTIIKDSYEKKEEKFSLTSINKISDDGIGETMIFSSRRNNHF